jgi:hypothetical protein
MAFNASRRQFTSVLRLQPRDYAFLRGLFECRSMTLAHAVALFFGGRTPAATKRLQTLKAGGYVLDRRRRVGEPSILCLTKKAFDELSAAGQLNGYPRLTPEQFAKRSRIETSTLSHELAVMDVKVSITTSIGKTAGRYAIEGFTTWPALSQFNAIHPEQRQRVTVRPDGFLHVVEKGDEGEEYDHRFFLEVDRSTEVQRLLADKCLCYRQYYTSGGFAERCGCAAEEFKRHPFRVLVVLQNAERRNNTAERLMNCSNPIRFQAWLTTLPEVLENPLGNVWIAPQDYALATEGTAYAPERRRDLKFYVRRPERERLVEERIVRRTLFEDAM